MSATVLITGGAGFIGSHLADALLARGHRVRVLDALDPQVHGPDCLRPPYLSSEVELRVGSVLDADAVASAMEGVGVVYHQAALVGVGQSMYEIRRYCEHNTVGAAVVLEEVVRRRDRIRKLVVASSMSIYGEGAYAGPTGAVFPRVRTRDALAAGRWEPIDPGTGSELRPAPTGEDKPLNPTSVYAISKRDHEELCLSVGYAYQVPTVALRYFNVYGTRQALSNPYTGVAAIFSARLLNGQPPVIFEDGNQSRDFVHVSDIVQANVLAMDRDGADYEAVNVGTGRPTTIRQVAAGIAAELGRPELECRLTGTFREGDIRHCFADVTKARTLLGYEPKVEFEDGVREVVEWVREQRPADNFDHAHRELTARGLA